MWTYEYDRGGNILSKKRHPYAEPTADNVLETTTFTYGNPDWKDQLTAVTNSAEPWNDATITYDAIGNPLDDGTWTYAWQNGRQLACMSTLGKNVSFKYNAQGLRVQKEVRYLQYPPKDTEVTNYTLHGKNVVHMTRGNDNLHFFYDVQNRPAVVVYNGTAYAYVKNLQGDIIAILDNTDTAVVSYTYDAWGAPTGTTGTMKDTLGKLNPFRYRGYVYDEDTKLYYLRNRYYHSERACFLNADALISGNLYQYCKNSPCDFSDHSGLCEDEDWSLFDYPGLDCIVESYAPAPVSREETFFNTHYLPLIMSYLQDSNDYSYPGKGKGGEPIDCSNLMCAITGQGSIMSRRRYSRYGGNKGKPFKNGKLAVELVVGMAVFKDSTRPNGDKVENGHVGMLMKYDFGDGEGEVWAVFQSVSVPVYKTQALYPGSTDTNFGPNITKFYNKDGTCGWKNYIDPWYYFDSQY